MASSGNFGTWNPKANYSTGTTFSNGNCTTAITQQNQYRACLGPAIPDSGKWYFEFFIDYQTAGFPSVIGVLDGTLDSSLDDGNYLSNAGSFHIEPMTGKLYSESTTGTSYTGNSGSPAAVGNADAKVGIAFDRDNNKLWFAVNNTWINVGSGVGNPATDSNPAVSSIEQNLSICHGIRQATGTSKVVINCGQDSTFGGLATAGGNADGNGFGDFFYSPPSGFLALCSANLPISSDIDPAGDDGETENPQEHFGVITYTGTGTSGTKSGLGFQPDFIWTKRLSGTNKRNYLVDSSRGFTKYLHSDGTFSEGTSSDGVTSATSDGFGIGGSLDYVNENTSTYVAWCWRANGGTTATSTAGTATSTVQANTKAGFSICLTDNYTAATGVTIGHGLTTAPDFYLHKTTGDNSSGGASQNFTWHVYHSGLGGTKALFLDTNATAATAIGYWNNTDPTSTVLSLGNLIAGNGQSVVYAWHNVDGLQRFGKYKGNGSNDGPFIYTGFRPRLFVQKRTDSTGSWRVWDSARHTFNPLDAIVRWEDEGAQDAANGQVSFLSNGVKIRMTYAEMNADGGDFVYMCWGDVPFKYSNIL